MAESNEDEKYKIKKGFCLIINIINFDGREDIKRNGSEENVKLIEEAFKCHRFEVVIKTDLNNDEMIEVINEQVTNTKCESLDAFVLYIHTHRIADHILCKNSYGKDEENKNIVTNVIHFNKIIKLFSDKNCEKLLKKPKIIFFDCCRTGDFILFIVYSIVAQSIYF